MFSVKLARILGGEHFGIPSGFEKVCIDSRKANEKTLFIPLKGSRRDGHSFIENAIQRGARGFLYSKPLNPQKFLKGRAFAVKINSTLEALRELARFKRQNFKGEKIIAITGTAGKTTAKEIVAFLLSTVFSTYKTPGNLNSQIGLPLSLANANVADFWVFELGASERGNIKRLTELLKPTVAVLTSLGKAHVEGFKNFENLSVAKGEIFLPPSVETAVLPAKFLPLYKATLEGKRVITFGGGGDVAIQHYRFKKNGTTEVVLNGKTFTVPFPGYAAVKAVEIGASVLKALGLEAEPFLKELPAFGGERGRMEPLFKGDYLVLDDSYNANPLSMEYSLKTLVSIEGYARRVAILGDMLELGVEEEREHRKLGKLLSTLPVDEVYLVGEAVKYTAEEIKNKPVKVFQNSEELKRFLKDREPQSDTVYLIKASRGIALETVLEIFE
jgi:UDP-N-acetylmuramoyl-tripeptide--D-alanyl-D-alanine ligase